MNREDEIAAYVEAYKDPDYKMGVRRKAHVEQILSELPVAGGMFRGLLLDIGTGRGETLEIATALGFQAMGTEVVPELIKPPKVVYAEAHKLPFMGDSFHHVTMFDVIEHLLPMDAEFALKEMAHVAKITATVSCSTESSIWNGRELHINKHTLEEWKDIIQCAWGRDAKYIGKCGRSECFQLRK